MMLMSSKQEHLSSLVFDLIKISPLFLGGNREHFISECAIHLYGPLHVPFRLQSSACVFLFLS
jgi:hypothetical protein